MGYNLRFTREDGEIYTFAQPPYFDVELFPGVGATGCADRSEFRIPVHAIIQGDGSGPEATIDNYLEFLDFVAGGSTFDVDLLLDGNVKRSFLRTEYIGSPRIEAIQPASHPGSKIENVEFTCMIIVQSGTDKAGLDPEKKLVRDVERFVETELYNDRLQRQSFAIRASGPSAKEKLQQYQYKGPKPVRETTVRQIDTTTFEKRWDFVPVQELTDYLTWEETVEVVGGQFDDNAPLFESLVTGKNSVPVIRKGRNRPVQLIVSGRVTSFKDDFKAPEPPFTKHLDPVESTRGAVGLLDPVAGIFERRYRYVYRRGSAKGIEAFLSKFPRPPLAKEEDPIEGGSVAPAFEENAEKKC